MMQVKYIYIKWKPQERLVVTERNRIVQNSQGREEAETDYFGRLPVAGRYCNCINLKASSNARYETI